MKNQRSLCALAKLGGLLLVLVLLAGMNGCTRAYFRDSSDREVNDILAEKNKDARWKIEQFHVYPDLRARYADPTNPDRPPMPPDDEATWQVTPHPQQPGKSGVANVYGTAFLEIIKVWDAQARAERTAAIAQEDPDTGTPDNPKHPIKAYFDDPINAVPKGFLLTMEQCIELGVINSREYQNFREELYEAALPVTQQRFSFAYQWAAVADFIRQWAGPKSAVGSQNNWTANSTLGFSKLFSTGALLTLDFANKTVWNFTGPQGFTSTSTLNLNVVQPLLQGGGKAVTLEPLTQAERNLFYSIRAYARFRKQFAVAVTLGSSLPGSLAAAAGTTTGSNPISVLAALGIASTDVSGGFVGYLSTLYRECDMAADKKLVHDLQKALRIYEGYEEGGIFSPLQVDQVRSTLIQAQNTILSDEQFMTNALDQFKLVLGLPANLPLILDDAAARPITRQLDRYYEVIEETDTANELLDKQERLAPEKLRDMLMRIYTQEPLVRGTKFREKLPAAWAKWVATKDADLKASIKKLDEQRSKLLDLKTDLALKKQIFSAADESRLREVEFQSDLGGLEQLLRLYETRPWEKLPKEEQFKSRVRLFRLVAHQAQFVLVWARNDRFDAIFTLWPAQPTARLDDLDLVTAEVEQAQEVAVQAALSNRVDLMNARAQVVDAWRQLKVTANALLGVFNIQYNLQSQTPPDGVRPLAFSAAASNSQLSFDLSLPVNRVAQRNAYRTSLITYQRARRNLIALEDNIAAQVRFDVRQLQLFTKNYHNQKKIVQSLYKQVEASKELVFGPPDPDQVKGGTANAVAGAALTNQYLGALNSLNGSQTKMYDIWLSLLATRMQLYLDLDRLPLDQRGVWIDEADTAACATPPVAEFRMQPAPNTTQGTTPPRLIPLTPAAEGNAPLARPVTFLPPLE